MTDQLKPCPMGHPDVILYTNSYPYVSCTKCGWTGPMGSTEANAADRWNTRPQDAEVERLRAENKQLRALAKFGKWALDTSREYITDVDALDIQDKAEELEILEPVLIDDDTRCGSDNCECDDGDFCYRYTDLAKLPEGL